jgi:hemoglobin
MKFDQITEETIKILIDTFYHKVRNDQVLGPIFANGIGVTDAEWALHLERMYDFWSSVMLASSKYQGNPMKKHKDLPPFKEELFDRWLTSF